MRVVCHGCHRVLVLPTSHNRFTDKQSYICSRECLLAVIRASRPMMPSPDTHELSISADVQPVNGGTAVFSYALAKFFRSRYEARVCEWLNSLGIPFEYERYCFVFDAAAGVQWTPDLYLPKQGIFLEIKGVKGAGFNKKLRLFREHVKHPVFLVHWMIEHQFPDLYDPCADFFGEEFDARY